MLPFQKKDRVKREKKIHTPRMERILESIEKMCFFAANTRDIRMGKIYMKQQNRWKIEKKQRTKHIRTRQQRTRTKNHQIKRANENDGNIPKFIALVKKLEKPNNKYLCEIRNGNRTDSMVEHHGQAILSQAMSHYNNNQNKNNVDTQKKPHIARFNEHRRIEI